MSKHDLGPALEHRARRWRFKAPDMDTASPELRKLCEGIAADEILGYCDSPAGLLWESAPEILRLKVWKARRQGAYMLASLQLAAIVLCLALRALGVIG